MKRKTDNTTIRVMTYNIHHGEGMDGHINLDRIATLIHSANADLVGLQEVDRHADRSHNLDMIKALAHLTSMHWAFGKNLELQNGDYGNGILTRFPIVHQENLHYKMVKSSERRGLLQVVIGIKNREIVFMNTHIDHCLDNSESISNVKQIRASANSYDGKPVIISGDFNETPKGQMIKEMELDFINASGAISQPVLTHRSTNLKTQIDYVFTSKDWTIRSIEVLYSLASDHLPLVAEISMDKM